eukprot:TRINITY_DN527_c0_g1_i10.p1 TRINITY_DN527_c0_g1~~TRINITY_DN527_c0_g1_i10.p1  ORF type:complete len:398 (-),score=127.98 TRINITY_DN527_c0_g1_i10:91-1284(-)
MTRARDNREKGDKVEKGEKGEPDKPETEAERRERELREQERDSKTVFVGNLPLRASEKELYEFFEKAGKVSDIQLISDRNTRKSRGFGYVEYETAESVPVALSLSGQPLKGQPIIVQITQSEKNKMASTSTSAATTFSGPSRLFVGSLHANVTEEDLRLIFATFGDIEFINLHVDPETKKSKGFAFVQYKRGEDARKALQNINGLELAGQQLKVGLVNEGGSSSGVGMLGELDDDEGGGLTLNAQSRALLMAKLQRGEPDMNFPIPTPSIPTVAVPPVPSAAIAAAVATVSASATGATPPTPNIVLRNMFDPVAEAKESPDFANEIKEDVSEECVKYGTLKHIHVDQQNPQGIVYLKFTDVAAATRAFAALNHRWFAGKMITAEYLTEAGYSKAAGV